MLCFQKILSCYEQKYGDNAIESQNLFFPKEEETEYPIDSSTKNGLFSSSLFKWTMNKGLDYISDMHLKNKMKMEMLFNNAKGDSTQPRVLLDFVARYDLSVMRCIKNYFDGIKQLDDESLAYAAYSVFYLREGNWTLTKSIIGKCVDKKQVDKLMDFKSSTGESMLFNICCGNISADKYAIINWYLTEIISDDHPLLFAQDLIDGKTILMQLIENGLVFLAQKLLDKVSDKAKKLKLIQMENNEKMNILDYVKERDIPAVDEWIQKQMALCL